MMITSSSRREHIIDPITETTIDGPLSSKNKHKVAHKIQKMRSWLKHESHYES